MPVHVRPVEKSMTDGDSLAAFLGQGDGMKNSAALIPELLADGIRLLVYAGNAGE